VPLIEIKVSDDEYAALFDMMRACGFGSPKSVCRHALHVLGQRLQLNLPTTLFTAAPQEAPRDRTARPVR
jgi:hypothetical protein